MKTVTRMTWADFRNTGLLLIVNQILHVFGIALVLEIKENEITDVYPARVVFRVFSEKSVEQAYRSVSEYMVNNAEKLKDEAGAD